MANDEHIKTTMFDLVLSPHNVAAPQVQSLTVTPTEKSDLATLENAVASSIWSDAKVTTTTRNIAPCEGLHSQYDVSVHTSAAQQITPSERS